MQVRLPTGEIESQIIEFPQTMRLKTPMTLSSEVTSGAQSHRDGRKKIRRIKAAKPIDRLEAKPKKKKVVAKSKSSFLKIQK